MNAEQIVQKIKEGDHQFVSEFFATQKKRYLEKIENETDPHDKNNLVDKYNRLASLIHEEYDDTIKANYGSLKSAIDWKLEKKYCTCESPSNEMKAVLRGLNELAIKERKDEKEAFRTAFKEDN